MNMQIKLNKKVIFTTIVLIVFCVDLYYCGICPRAEVISPCTCEHNAKITCTGEEFSTADLVKRFQTLYMIFEEEDDLARTYETFVLQYANSVVEIPDNVFNGIRFRRISFVNVTNLTIIHSNAFASMAEEVLELRITGENQLGSIPEYDKSLFDALSTLVNARTITLDHHKLTQIPAHAFESLGGEQNSLMELRFDERAPQLGIKSIGNYAFYELPSLVELRLSNQMLTTISKHVFQFHSGETEPIEINLSYNNLATTSFELGAFINANRPIVLDLSHNPRLVTLQERIFAPFFELDPKNSVRVTGNVMNCDCTNFWIMKNRALFTDNRVLDAACNVTGTMRALSAFNMSSIKC